MTFTSTFFFFLVDPCSNGQSLRACLKRLLPFLFFWAKVELVKGVFEGCPRGDTKEAPPVGVPSHYDVRAAVFADSEATSSSMVLEVKQARNHICCLFFHRYALSCLAVLLGRVALETIVYSVFLCPEQHRQ